MRNRGSVLSHATRVGTVLAMVSGAVVGIATPSFAATLTVTPTKGPAAGTQTIVVSGATFAAGAAVEFQTATTCSTTYATAAAGSVIVAPTATVNSPATTMNVVVPTL